MNFKEINGKKSEYEARIVIGYIITGVSFILFLPLGAAGGPAVAFLIMIPFMGGAVYAGMNHKKVKALSTEFKKAYVQKELIKIFPDSKYYYDRGFFEDEVVSSGLLRKQDRYSSEDLIEGQSNGLRFRCSDIVQKDVRSNGKTTTVVTVFQGRFYEFDFPKKFKHNLLLLQPFSFRPFSGMKVVKTESVKFNFELKIYAENEEEAFYILTPQMMERLLYMDKKYHDKITFSFLENKLYIAIDTRYDTFDFKAFQQVDDSIITDYRNELNDIKEFIKVLQLDETLFRLE